MPLETSHPEFIKYPNTLHFPGFKKETLKRRYAEIAEHNTKAPVPDKAEFRGTIKIHGTNVTIVFTHCKNLESFYVQSRNKVICAGPSTDCIGTVEFLSGIPVSRLAQSVFGDGPAAFKQLIIAGEFAGKGILKGAGVADLKRFFMVFNVRVDGVWQDMARLSHVCLPEHRVYNIMSFKTFKLWIDLTRDTTSMEIKMREYTEQVAKVCPVAKALGGGGGGEGIVWSMLVPTRHNVGGLLCFKTKAELFATTASVPKAIANSESKAVADSFVNYALGERRLEQGISYMIEMGIALHIGNVKKFTRWVIDDTLREEADWFEVLGADSGLVRGKIGILAREYYIRHLKKL